jgi:hypothetical protein
MHSKYDSVGVCAGNLGANNERNDIPTELAQRNENMDVHSVLD